MKKFALAAIGATSMLALAACQADEAEEVMGGEEPVATAEPGDGDGTTATVEGAEGTEEAATDGEAVTAEGEAEAGTEGDAEATEEDAGE